MNDNYRFMQNGNWRYPQLSYETQLKVLERDKYTCKKCGFYSSNRSLLALDHVICRAKGGDNSIENLQVLCRPCNLKKGKMDNEEFMKSDAIRLSNNIKSLEILMIIKIILEKY